MKTLILTIGILIPAIATAESEPIQVIKTEKYVEETQNSVRIPTPFGKPILITPHAAELLEGQHIYRVDLIYTAYKQAASFDQVKLNKSRLASLEKLLPQLKTDAPEIRYIEQTGATGNEEAKSYYHGFVLHYGLDKKDTYSFFRQFDKDYEVLEIDNTRDTSVLLQSGTVLHIPENAVSTPQGKNVNGNYLLKYREFRDPADITLSGIPMTYEDESGVSDFESYGMLELRGELNEQELNLTKAVTVDFNCTDTGERVDFYSLDEASGEWTSLQPVSFAANTEVAEVKEAKDWYWEHRGMKGSVLIEFGSDCFREVMDSLSKDPNWSSRMNELRIREDQGSILTNHDSYHDLLQFLHSCAYPGEGRLAEKDYRLDDKARVKANTLVRGLRINRFGIFNCDGKSKLKNSQEVRPYFVDAETREEIACQLKVTLILDRSNRSISYYPSSVKCEANRKNTLLLFTEDGRIFLHKNLFVDKDENGDVLSTQITMTEISDEVKDSEDLRKLIH